MGVAYYPELEQEIPGYDPCVEVSGKPLARAIDALDKICAELGVPRVLSFYSESTEEACAKIGAPVPPGMRKDPVRWSQPRDGLKTFSAIIAYLKDRPDQLKDSARVREDLEAFQKVLEKAQQHKTRFRLRIDI
jgi:hypothetical protein